MYHSEAVTVAVTGMGAARAARMAEAVAERHPPGRVIISGFAGATHPGLAVAEVIEPRGLVRQATGELFTPSDAEGGVGDVAEGAAADSRRGRLMTCDTLLSTPRQKAALHERHGVDAVDMESAALAAWCERRGLRWRCIRVISDAADQALPAFVEGFTRADGRPDLYAAARYSFMRPWVVPTLIRLARDTAAAAATLADRLEAELAR